MNYIHQLKQRLDKKTLEVKAYEQGIAELMVYLNSPKFYSDPTVQARDVMHRLNEMLSNAAEAAHRASPDPVIVKIPY